MPICLQSGVCVCVCLREGSLVHFSLQKNNCTCAVPSLPDRKMSRTALQFVRSLSNRFSLLCSCVVTCLSCVSQRACVFARVSVRACVCVCVWSLCSACLSRSTCVRARVCGPQSVFPHHALLRAGLRLLVPGPAACGCWVVLCHVRMRFWLSVHLCSDGFGFPAPELRVRLVGPAHVMVLWGGLGRASPPAGGGGWCFVGGGRAAASTAPTGTGRTWAPSHRPGGPPWALIVCPSSALGPSRGAPRWRGAATTVAHDLRRSCGAGAVSRAWAPGGRTARQHMRAQ